jgi:hypothetical protein
MSIPADTDNQKSFDKNLVFTPAIYEIRVNGRLGSQTAAWFEDMTLTVTMKKPPHLKPSSGATSQIRLPCTG